jgi:hypothetical protein
MNNFQWRTDLNEIIDLGDKVNYKVFSDGGDGVELTFDNVNYMKPNTQKMVYMVGILFYLKMEKLFKIFGLNNGVV